MEKNQAHLIHAGNFLLDASELKMVDKVQRFQRLIELNKGVRLNTLHISLNFHPDDRLSREKLITIAAEYMEKIGFARQPYLVYQHTDAAHPHLHLLTTNVGPDAKRLPSFDLALNTPIPIHQQLEAKHGLIRAVKRERIVASSPDNQPAQRAEYGKTGTFQAISTILDHVLPVYNYTNLTELNALLRQFNVRADNGKPGGAFHEHRALIYQLLDNDGKGIGRGIVASSLDARPVLSRLEERFHDNDKIMSQEIQRLSARIEQALYAGPQDFTGFAAELQKHNIQVVPYLDEEKRLYSLVFIDYQKKIARASAALDPSLANDPLLRKLGYDRERDLRLSLADRDQRTPSKDISRAIEFLGRHQSDEHQHEHIRELKHIRQR